MTIRRSALSIALISLATSVAAPALAAFETEEQTTTAAAGTDAKAETEASKVDADKSTTKKTGKDAKKKEPKASSLHVQCDGYPDDMGAGETAARIIGAITLLGLFAPPPEAAKPEARKLGADGVTVCNQLLDGEKAEGNQFRKMQLMMARAIHKIEAKDYDGAVGDVALARNIANEAGYTKDPYFQRSMGISMADLEGAALIRAGRSAEAMQASLQDLDKVKHQFWRFLTQPTYANYIKQNHALLDRHYDQQARIYPAGSPGVASYYENQGQFAKAAALREAIIDWHSSGKPDHLHTSVLANAALSHALAGDWARAAARAQEARDNDKKRMTDGKPDTDRSENNEVLDLYEVLKLHHEGNGVGARRMFTGRSTWLAPSNGAVREANKRLRASANPDELINMLAKDHDALWQERRDTDIAELMAKDTDNKTLFGKIDGYNKANGWELMSKTVWNTKKSKILQKPNEKNGLIPAWIYNGYYNFYAQLDAILLHAALTAREKGETHIMFSPNIDKDIQFASIRFGKIGDPGIPELLALNVNDVIAELEDVIPSPEALKARKAEASKTKKKT